MDHFESQTIDYIKDKYKYVIDYSKFDNKPVLILYEFYGQILYSQEHYNFDEKIIKVKEALKTNNSLNKQLLEEYKNEINELEEKIKATKKNIGDDNSYFVRLLEFEIKIDYSRYKNNYYAKDIYKKLEKGVIDELAAKNIAYEKLLVFFDDKLRDLFNKLKINVNF